MRKGTNQMAGTPKARHPTPSPGLGSIFQLSLHPGEAESTTGYFLSPPLAFAWLYESFFVTGLGAWGPVVYRKEREP